MPETVPSKLSKPDLRRFIRGALKALPVDEIQSRSRSLMHHLTLDETWLVPGGVVALFGGLPGEPDFLPLIPWLHERGARAAFFAVSGTELQPYEVRSPEDLKRGTLNVWEPVVDAARLVADRYLATVLTPALAFGQSDGSRIGRGAGFYDRLFARPEVTAQRIGIALDLQILPQIPTEAHDARVDAIVTESGWIRF